MLSRDVEVGSEVSPANLPVSIDEPPVEVVLKCKLRAENVSMLFRRREGRRHEDTSCARPPTLVCAVASPDALPKTPTHDQKIQVFASVRGVRGRQLERVDPGL